jgi:SAM-dependent methyltransferase
VEGDAVDERTLSQAMPDAREGGEVPAGAPDLPRIRAYYDETWLDYRFLWLSPRRNGAIHFGYWDNRTRGHADSLLNMNRLLADHIADTGGARQRDLSPSMPLAPGRRVLDAGCGVGGSSLWLAKTYGVAVVGITPVASQIARARGEAAREGLAARVTFEQQDYTRTRFADACFDVVWAIESVCHAPDKRRFLAEARRLLRSGGRLGVVEYMRFCRPYPMADESLLQSWLSGWAIPDIATRGEFVAWASAAGFADVRVEDITSGTEPSLRRLYRMTQACWWGASLLRQMGLRSQMQHGNMRGARDIYRARRRGLWFEALLTATAA